MARGGGRRGGRGSSGSGAPSDLYACILLILNGLFFGGWGIVSLLSWRDKRIKSKYDNIIPEKVMKAFDHFYMCYNAKYKSILKCYKSRIHKFEDREAKGKHINSYHKEQYLLDKKCMTILVDYFILAFNGRDNIRSDSFISPDLAKKIYSIAKDTI